MNQISSDECVVALERLRREAASGRYQAGQRLTVIKAMLFSAVDFSESDLQRILRKSEYSLPIARSIKLYVMMARLTQLCEAKGSATGPACAVTLIDFENLTWAGVLDVKGKAGFGLFFSLPGIVNKTTKFSALNFLSPEQKHLYYRAKPYFIEKKKPTLQSLAASLLKEECPNDGYSERSVNRYIHAFRDFKFADQDNRRTFLIQTVESFGEDNWSMRQMYAECFPSLVTALQRVFRSLTPVITQMQLQLTAVASRLLLPSHLKKGSQN
jgi:hypothetical protein